MAQLFGKGTIKSNIQVLSGFDSSKIEIVKDLYRDWKNGLLSDEVKYKEKFNQVFFGDLLGYENRINRIPEGTIPGAGSADITLGYFNDGKYTLEDIQVVCELKGAKTNLIKKQFGHGGLSPVGQGFAYKTGLKNCKWLIVSNFYEIRLYRDNTTDFEVRNLEELIDEKDDYFNLRKLYLLLHRDNLLTHTGVSKTEHLLSHFREEQKEITKQFYKDYKGLRTELINDIRQHNTGLSIETIIEKSQKIIDRLIFIFFCEDKGLLPDKKLKENIVRAREAGFSSWEVTKKFFSLVDKGSESLGIPNGYNGGLFKQDEILDSIEISDPICKKFVNLTDYDFDDELSVNVLGHIFEQSISDLENLKIDLLGTETELDELVDTGKGRRKKDGIFYTPEYIVDYIVQNSVMKYLNEKEDECLAKYKKDEIKAYQAYQQILQNIKVLDPACGSGAFLVRVFDVLLEENERVGKILESLGVKGFFDNTTLYKDILTNNIYGVDLNEESVEITKLSLWLKSAQKDKKLNNLDANIKCGNSLIDDPAIAGGKAFNWQKSFSNIFHKEEIKTRMITRATHNTRISEKMVELGIQLGEPVIMDENMEIEITGYIGEIVQEDNLTILAYNICKDHIHMILQCTERERDNIVRKLKGKSTQLYKESHKIKNELHLRGQKYNHSEIKDEKYLFNAMQYIETNREHHDLPPVSTSKGLQPLVRDIVCSQYNFEQIKHKYFGGFDVIVGNPPYGAKLNTEEKLFYQNKFSVFQGNFEIYFFFIENCKILLKEKGILGFITPDTWIRIPQAKRLREFVLNYFGIEKIVCFGYPVFEEAAVNTIIFIIRHDFKCNSCKVINVPNMNDIQNLTNEKVYECAVSLWRSSADKQFQILQKDIEQKIINKILKNTFRGEDILDISQGIVPYSIENLTMEEVKKRIYHSNNKLDDTYGVWAQGRTLKRYALNISNVEYLKYGSRLHRPRKEKYFMGERILIQEITGGNPPRINATKYKDVLFHDPGIIACLNRSELSTDYILSIINSRLISWYNEINSPKGNRKTFPKVLIGDIRNFPIRNVSEEVQQPFIERADKMLSLNKEFHELTSKFLKRLQDNLHIEKLTKKLENFYDGDFKDFVAELKKQKISLSLKDQDEREPYFNEYREVILARKAEIDRTDKEIDEMVFDLYGLNQEERRVVLGG